MHYGSEAGTFGVSEMARLAVLNELCGQTKLFIMQFLRLAAETINCPGLM